MHDDYIHRLREKVGHQPIILNFAGGILTNPQGDVLLQKRTDFDAWGLPGGALELLAKVRSKRVSVNLKKKQAWMCK